MQMNGYRSSTLNAMSLLGGEEEIVPSDNYRRTHSTTSSKSLHDVPLFVSKIQAPASTWEQTGMKLDIFAERMNLLVEDN